jgi:type VI secretion system secreted protein Hcp
MGMTQKTGGLASRIGRPLLTGALSAAALAPVPAAADGWLTLTGIQGGSQVTAGAIDVMSYTQGFSNTARRAAGTTGGPGAITCGDVHFTKAIDSSSPDLVRLVTTGTHVPTGVFTFRRDGANFDHYKITMSDVVVTSVQNSEGAGEIIETVSLIADRYQFEHIAQGPAGQPIVTRFGWDCVTNKKL